MQVCMNVQAASTAKAAASGNDSAGKGGMEFSSLLSGLKGNSFQGDFMSSIISTSREASSSRMERARQARPESRPIAWERAGGGKDQAAPERAGKGRPEARPSASEAPRQGQGRGAAEVSREDAGRGDARVSAPEVGQELDRTVAVGQATMADVDLSQSLEDFASQGGARPVELVPEAVDQADPVMDLAPAESGEAIARLLPEEARAEADPMAILDNGELIWPGDKPTVYPGLDGAGESLEKVVDPKALVMAAAEAVPAPAVAETQVVAEAPVLGDLPTDSAQSTGEEAVLAPRAVALAPQDGGEDAGQDPLSRYLSREQGRQAQGSGKALDLAQQAQRDLPADEQIVSRLRDLNAQSPLRQAVAQEPTGDALQRRVDQLADQLGASKITVKDALAMARQQGQVEKGLDLAQSQSWKISELAARSAGAAATVASAAAPVRSQLSDALATLRETLSGGKVMTVAEATAQRQGAALPALATSADGQLGQQGSGLASQQFSQGFLMQGLQQGLGTTSGSGTATLAGAQGQLSLSASDSENARALAEKVLSMAARNMKQMELELNPANLGKIKLSFGLDASNEATRLTIAAMNPATAELLEGALSDLKVSLARLGLELDPVVVDYQDAEGEGALAQEGGDGGDYGDAPAGNGEGTLFASGDDGAGEGDGTSPGEVASEALDEGGLSMYA
ncbi:MAG: flagellar hook-length control protein FliK [Succinivibrionaceae bacterium]|nr:flagellar hook-length control protein FliK [Succinivibrionaceae bacterium]